MEMICELPFASRAPLFSGPVFSAPWLLGAVVAFTALRVQNGA